MNHIIRKILPGYIFIILLEKSSKADEIPDCETKSEAELSYAECTGKIFSSLENTFEPNIHGLKLVNCTIEVINEFSLSKYKKLRKIVMIKTRIDQQLDNKLFHSLKHLKDLSLESTIVKGIGNTQWPPAIKYINLTRCNLTDFKISAETLSLKRLVLDHNNLATFPKLPPTTPLEEIYLDYNKDIVISAEDIMPFCHLTIFQANEIARSVGFFKKNFCRCARTIKWLEDHNVMHNLGQCDDTECDLRYSGKYLDRYNSCKYKNQPSLSKLPFVLIGVVLVLIILLTVAYLIMRIQLSRRATKFVIHGELKDGVKREKKHKKRPKN